MINKSKKCLALSLSLISLISSVGSFKVFASGRDESYHAMEISEPQLTATEESQPTSEESNFNEETKTLTLLSDCDFEKFKNNSTIRENVETVVLGECVTEIPEKFFYKCSNLKSVKGNNVKSVSFYAFAFCSQLTEVYLPNVEFLNNYAFEYCVFLKNVNFPNVKFVCPCAFEGCMGLEKVELSPECRISFSAFDCSSFMINGYEESKRWERTENNKPGTVIHRPETTLNFNEEKKTLTISSPNDFIPFMKDSRIRNIVEKVVFSDEIYTVPAYAFSNCPRLKVVKKRNADYIQDHAFSGCKELTNAGYDLAEIGDYAFQGCSKLEVPLVIRPSSRGEQVPRVGKFAFQGCEKLWSVMFYDVKEIGEYAFQGCSGLMYIKIAHPAKGSFTNMQPRKTIIKEFAFQDCSQLKKMDLSSNRGYELIIKEHAFDGCPSHERKALYLLNDMRTYDPHEGEDFAPKYYGLKSFHKLVRELNSSLYDCLWDMQIISLEEFEMRGYLPKDPALREAVLKGKASKDVYEGMVKKLAKDKIVLKEEDVIKLFGKNVESDFDKIFIEYDFVK